MTDRHVVRNSPAYPPLQQHDVIDPDDEVKDYSEIFKETADDLTCNDTVKVYQEEGTPYISHSASFSDLREVAENHQPEPLIAVQDSTPPDETVKVYHTEDTPYNFSNASSLSDLTALSGHQSVSDPTHSALTSPRPAQQAKGFTSSACNSHKLTPVLEDVVETPLIYSRSSPLGSISDEECNEIVDGNESVSSEFSRREEESEAVSPSDFPESPGEFEPLAKPPPPPVPPKPAGLLLKLQAKRQEGFVPPPIKFQDTPPAPPGLSAPNTTPQVLDQPVEDTESSLHKSDDDEDDGIDYLDPWVQIGLTARSSVAVPKGKLLNCEAKTQSCRQQSQNQKYTTLAIAEVEVNGITNISTSGSEPEFEDEYAFIKSYMEQGLRGGECSPPPPPLPAKRKSVNSTASQIKPPAGIGSKPLPSPAVNGSFARSGSRSGSGSLPQRSPPAVPSLVLQTSDPELQTASPAASSSSSSSCRKPLLETDIDSIVNYEMFLKSINSAGS